MNAQAFLVREPILDKQQALSGYDMRWATPGGGDLLSLLADPEDDSWRLKDRFVLTDQPPTPLARASRLPKSACVVELQGATATAESADTLRQVGIACCVRTPSKEPLPPDLYPSLSYLSLDVHQLGTALTKASASLRKLNAKQIGRNITSLDSFALSKEAGLDYFQGYWFLKPGTQAGAQIGPAYASLVTLMRLAQENAPVVKLEAVLKRDAALSFKLLRYINSAGFGLSCEIQSLRHAVAVLGYQNLYRWLGLLMINAARKSASDALVTTAVVRGRLVELLGQHLFDAGERDNLFIVGMFSLLDALMRVPMEEIVSQIPLPESVCDALLHRQGPYGPFLQLAEALEHLTESGTLDNAEMLAMSLSLTPAQVNRAQIDALVWADSLATN